MGGGANLYSLEAISDALIGAGSIAASSRDEQQIIRGYLVPLQSVLHTECVAFFPSISAPSGLSGVMAEGLSMQLPPQLLASMELAIRNAAHQTVTSEDAAFLHGHLKHIPGACTTAASMWSCVPAGESDFGTVGVFDVASRTFDRVEQQVLRTFALQLSYALKSLAARKQAAQASNPNAREVHRYIESTQFVGNVARDLTNPLTALFGYIELLRGEKLTDQSRTYLQKLQVQAEKMQDIIIAMHSAPKPPRDHSEELERETQQVPRELALVPPPLQIEPVFTQSSEPVQLKRQRSATGRSCVLVIQKNDAVVEFEKSVLASLNADVFTANSGTDAIALLAKHDIHAIILGDELEGEWRSKSLLEWIEANRPELRNRVLLTVSAQPRSEIVELVETEKIPFVTKPLQIMDLFAGMKQILGFSPQQLDKKFLN